MSQRPCPKRGYISAIFPPFNVCVCVCVMMTQVGCTPVCLVCDKKSIKTIMLPRPSCQTRLNQVHKQVQSKRCIIQWQSFISATTYRLVPNNLEAVGAFRHSRLVYPSGQKSLEMAHEPRGGCFKLWVKKSCSCFLHSPRSHVGNILWNSEPDSRHGRHFSQCFWSAL